jgi:predicted NUDIX family NTP pyrophosphohydrolase
VWPELSTRLTRGPRPLCTTSVSSVSAFTSEYNVGVPKTSAGLLIYRRANATCEVLLVHPGGPFWAKKDAGAWSIPKGEPEAGEDVRPCALRELGEELGPAAPALDPAGLIELGSVRQKGGKLVRAWAAEGDFDPAKLASNSFEQEWPPRSGARREFPEVDRAEWLDPEEARRRILPAQAPLIDRLLEALDRAYTRRDG